MGQHFSKVRGPRAYWAPQTKSQPPPGSDAMMMMTMTMTMMIMMTMTYSWQIKLWNSGHWADVLSIRRQLHFTDNCFYIAYNQYYKNIAQAPTAPGDRFSVVTLCKPGKRITQYHTQREKTFATLKQQPCTCRSNIFSDNLPSSDTATRLNLLPKCNKKIRLLGNRHRSRTSALVKTKGKNKNWLK